MKFYVCDGQMIFLQLFLSYLIILIMKSKIRDDKNLQESGDDENEEFEKDRKIKRLSQINKELIETLKQQNEQLTKKIAKQKLKPSRSSSLKSGNKNGKQLESIRKELSNAYKQIDMYKDIIMNLKAKEVSVEHVDKIYELQNRVKNEDNNIQNYQKEIKYLNGLREKQEKELKIYENEEVKQTKINLEKEITELKEKLKHLKKNATKRQDIEKRQHAYFVELEKAIRKANDDYYPGKSEKKEQQKDEQISEAQWGTVKNKLSELRRSYQENNKRLDMINRQKIRELKSYEQNELKLKEKNRKLNTLKSKIAELTKLTIIKQSKEIRPEVLVKREQFVKNDKNKTFNQREVKKWNVPQGFSLEKGKVLPNSIFVSDKGILDGQSKYKVVSVQIWSDGNGVPSLLHFTYQNQDGEIIQGKEMTQNVPSNLQMKAFNLAEKDYLWQITGKFTSGLLSSITLKSKLGKEAVFEDSNAQQMGEPFNFYSKPNDIPCCFYGAIIRPKEGQVRICYLGCQFISDW